MDFSILDSSTTTKLVDVNKYIKWKSEVIVQKFCFCGQ